MILDMITWIATAFLIGFIIGIGTAAIIRNTGREEQKERGRE